MSILPILGAKEILRRLLRARFKIAQQRGSHVKLWHPITKHRTAIPLHGGQKIGRGLLVKIIKQAGLTVKEFLDL